LFHTGVLDVSIWRNLFLVNAREAVAPEWCMKRISVMCILSLVHCAQSENPVQAEDPGQSELGMVADAQPPRQDAALVERRDSGVSDAGEVLLPTALDLNDVSVMFPLPQASVDELLPLSASQLTEAQFNAMDGEEQRLAQAGGSLPYAMWRIVSVRLDPCARGKVSEPCARELRLVAQPLTNDRGFRFVDEALHLIYRYDANEFDELVRAWSAILRAQSPRPAVDLGVHPLLEVQGNGGLFANGIKAWIARFATAQALRRVASTPFNGGVRWPFLQFKKEQSTLTVQTSLPCMPAGTAAEVLIDEPGAPVGPFGLVPASTCANELQVFAKGQFNASTDSQKNQVTDAALRVLNPKITGVDEVDCASCHIASRRLGQAKGAAFLTLDDGNAARYRPTSGAPAGGSRAVRWVDGNPRGDYRVRAFGWFLAELNISQRTVNDSDRVLTDLRRMYSP
jgi:hypothetical protein